MFLVSNLTFTPPLKRRLTHYSNNFHCCQLTASDTSQRQHCQSNRKTITPTETINVVSS